MGILSKLKKVVFVDFRISKYRFLSDCKRVEGTPMLYFPLLLKGSGKVVFKDKVQMGVIASPGFYSGYSYIEARNQNSSVLIGSNTAINNNFSAIAFSEISIGDNVLIGNNCSIMDTDGHFLDSTKRNDSNPPALPVHIMNGVFIGSNVIILKGVTIGKNSVIGSGSVVTKSIPDNVIAAGNPAKIIKALTSE